MSALTTCSHCDNPFERTHNGQTFCSVECRFWSKVDMAKSCWEWRGSSTTGYGTFSLNGRPHLAHRIAWILHNGEPPGDSMILHNCDNRLCCNPDHLYPGSHQNNMDDMTSRNRQSAGTKHSELLLANRGLGRVSKLKKRVRSTLRLSKKLSTEQVVAIREACASGQCQGYVAKRFSLHNSTVSNIARGRTYKNIGGPRTLAYKKRR